MARTYEIVYVEISGEEPTPEIQFVDDNEVVWVVPVDESNTDYQAYLASLEEQA